MIKIFNKFKIIKLIWLLSFTLLVACTDNKYYIKINKIHSNKNLIKDLTIPPNTLLQ